MKPVLIVENSTNSLKVNENSTSKDGYLLSGIFTEFDVKNRNERIYTANKFIPCLNELNERISSLGAVYGEFDHPDVFDTSLSRSSHLVKRAFYKKESNRVEGEIKLLSTYWGKEAKALVNDGCPIFVSSRAAGVTESDGTVTLKKLFTYDIVADPGFSSAKMEVKVLNESLGFKNPKSNFRIYEMSDESKINQLFNMNSNDFVTKKQLADYSQYLITEIANTKKVATSAIKSGNISPKKLEQLLEYYEELNSTNSQMVKYLDYLAEKIQVVVDENISLKSITEKLISHNDYLAESLENSINYSEYLAESVDKNISYSEYLAGTVDKSIEYSKYLAETLDKNISYSEYLAEHVQKGIEYSEYLAENLDKNIAYSEYIAESLDKNIAYSEYIAENVDKAIEYSDYLAEHVDGNIAYSEYIAENLGDNIAYSEYLAESIDKTLGYAGMITEKLNNRKINENLYDRLPSPEESGFETIKDETDEEDYGDYYEDDEENYEEDIHGEDNMEEFEESTGYIGESDTELSKQIDKLIEEAKKRKVSETNDLHFLKFLNKSQVDSFYNLTNEEQEQVKLYINEKRYFTNSDVLKLIQEALSEKSESLEERLIRLMPENVKPIWSKLNESSKRSILSQARLYPDLTNESKIEHFWLTRSLKKNESVTKKLVDHNPLIQEDKLSDNEMRAIMERFKTV